MRRIWVRESIVMAIRGTAIVVTMNVGAFAVAMAAADAPPLLPIDKLLATDAALPDSFGGAVAIHGEVAVIGAVGVVSPDGEVDTMGAAYIFRRDGVGDWTQSIALEPITTVSTPGLDGVLFGSSVAIHGDVLMVGAPRDDEAANNAGAVVVFFRIPGVIEEFTVETKIVADDASSNDQFGSAVALHGSRAVIVGGGAAYVFRHEAPQIWVQEAKLVPDSGGDDSLGIFSVAIEGDRIVLGAPFDDVGAVQLAGAAYVFDRDASGAWTQEARLVSDSLVTLGQFGLSVSVSGDRVVAGRHSGYTGTRTAFIFERAAEGAEISWTQTAALSIADGATADEFAKSVAISGDTVVVGAPGDDAACGGGACNAGAAYLFRRLPTGTWSAPRVLLSDDPGEGDRFGEAVSIDGAVALAGVPGDDDACPSLSICHSGSALLFGTDVFSADLNGDWLVTGEDLAILLGAWGACLSCAADFNHDGVVDGTDLAVLLGAWS